MCSKLATGYGTTVYFRKLHWPLELELQYTVVYWPLELEIQSTVVHWSLELALKSSVSTVAGPFCNSSTKAVPGCSYNGPGCNISNVAGPV